MKHAINKLVLCIIMTAAACAAHADSSIPPHAVKGSIDLTAWDLQTQGNVQLDGDWEFYWHELFEPDHFNTALKTQPAFMHVPRAWNGTKIQNIHIDGIGYATYRLSVKTGYRGTVGIKLLDAACAYKLWVNGRLLAENGIVGSSTDAFLPFFKPQTIFFESDGNGIELIIQVANYSHKKGGLWESITFGDARQIQNNRDRSLNTELFLIGALLIMSFYHVGLFFFRRKDFSTLFFSLLCLLITLRTGFTGERYFIQLFPFMPWELSQKFEYLSAYLAPTFFLLFISATFNDEIPSRIIQWIRNSLISFGAALSIMILISPVMIISYTLNIFTVYFALVAILIFYFMILAIRRKKDGAKLLLAGFTVVIALSVNDILYSNLIINTGNYAPAGIFIFILTQSYIISLRFSKAFDHVEILSGQLRANNTQLINLNAQLEQKNREITQRLFIDRLTGMPNRQSLFIDVSSIEKPVLFLIDIDSFKEINDFYGNKIGDFVLKEVAQIIKGFLSDNQSLYKLSVDEYAILVNGGMNLIEASAFAHFLCREISKKPIAHGTDEIFIRISIGAAIGDLTGMERSFEEIIVRADMALKRAKHSGKPYIVYDESMQIIKEYEKNMFWARKLKTAIENDTIVPFYQPIVNNVTGAIDKYECLIRLIDEDGQTISPYHFLDIARKSRLYPELTKIMIRKSFQMFSTVPCEFSINISIDDILDEDTRSYIFETMNRYSEVCPRLVLELLESQGIENYSEVIDFINVVKSFGAKIAVDDFGSGYSNFEHILKLNVDYIKIDASLIKNIHLDRNSRAIVKTISVFARELGIKTVAEFVHCKEVHDIGIELGLNYSQGYYLGEPKSGIVHQS